MLKTFLITWLKVAAAYPLFVGVMYGLFQAGKDTNFQQAEPDLYQNLVDFINFLLALLVEHWLLVIIFSAFLALLWTLVVAEPKTKSKAAFSRQVRERMPPRTGDKP
jgi:hypothetical protein